MSIGAPSSFHSTCGKLKSPIRMIPEYFPLLSKFEVDSSEVDMAISESLGQLVSFCGGGLYMQPTSSVFWSRSSYFNWSRCIIRMDERNITHRRVC
ncbi:hypothetical protein BpHYR1_046058 [Brachionus plicatilis]|uniref:Uncharacterized protein n=1 Tax=Brachionus plicatilis TaxID=10195 RepID=A0A3M7RNT1_BRAPC|nr:hypothetical protein BpHYR1_046058 [Brachionus plicatilis]